MTYAATIDFLFGIRRRGQKLGLETMRALAHRLGDPQESLRFIHIAGTNGKGSVAAMCRAVLTRAGYKTGLYTSPHLVSFCERFQIDGRRITEADVVRLVAELQPKLQAPGDRDPTFFEVVTALALQYFREQQADVVVWETGLGGRLDATNIVTPLVSVITNVAFDHMQYLGESLDQIAAEKCGIIKPGVPVVTAARDPIVLQVIRDTCAARGSALTVVEQPAADETPLAGAHQRWNCATAVAALRVSGLRITDEEIATGLRATSWPGRFQELGRVILDGAHNVAAAQVLAATLRQRFGEQQITLILGVLGDKNYADMCGVLAPLAVRIICMRVNSDRTCDPAALAGLCRQANPAAEVRVGATLRESLAWAEAWPHPIVVTGSLFLVGEALALLGAPAACEREIALQ